MTIHSVKKTEFPDLVYYCKDCEKIVEAEKVGRRYVYKCPLCKTKNVAFGSKKSITNYFHLTEEDFNNEQ